MGTCFFCLDHIIHFGKCMYVHTVPKASPGLHVANTWTQTLAMCSSVVILKLFNLYEIRISAQIFFSRSFFFFKFLVFRAALISWHLEVRRLGVESELQLQAYTIATAMQDLSQVCDLHRSSQQCWLLNSLSKARDQTSTLMYTSQIHFCWTTGGVSIKPHLLSGLSVRRNLVIIMAELASNSWNFYT